MQENNNAENRSDSQKTFTAKDRLYWSAKLSCTIRDLIKAEVKVGADPKLIATYLGRAK